MKSDQWIVWIEYEEDGQSRGHHLYESHETFPRDEAAERAIRYLRSLSAGPESERAMIVPQDDDSLIWSQAQVLSTGQQGCDLIRQERKRQIDDEGYSVAHDDLHTDGELARAAQAYLMVYNGSIYGQALAEWPWDQDGFNPNDNQPVHDLIRAGALIAAEIDRLEREGAGHDD